MENDRFDRLLGAMVKGEAPSARKSATDAAIGPH